jgi:hypothetical protein
MKKPPYPALVKPDAVVLLPPEESEERDPRGLWPEPRRRPRWISLLVIAGIFVAGLGIGLRLASRGAPAPIEPMEASVGPGAAAPAGEADDIGAMAADAVPGPVGEEPGAPQEAAPAPLADAPAEVRRPEPDGRREPALPANPAPGGNLASAAPDVAPDTTPLELAPAPVGRTIIQQAEPVAASVPSPLALEPPAPDPAVVREEARQALARGAERFAAAVTSARTASTAALTSQILASDGAARGLIDFVRGSKPTASVAGVGPVTVLDGTAQADATLQLEWRGDFGVTRRGQVRVRLLARNGEGEWRVAGAQPLDGSPR